MTGDMRSFFFTRASQRKYSQPLQRALRKHSPTPRQVDGSLGHSVQPCRLRKHHSCRICSTNLVSESSEKFVLCLSRYDFSGPSGQAVAFQQQSSLFVSSIFQLWLSATICYTLFVRGVSLNLYQGLLISSVHFPYRLSCIQRHSVLLWRVMTHGVFNLNVITPTQCKGRAVHQQ